MLPRASSAERGRSAATIVGFAVRCKTYSRGRVPQLRLGACGGGTLRPGDSSVRLGAIARPSLAQDCDLASRGLINGSLRRWRIGVADVVRGWRSSEQRRRETHDRTIGRSDDRIGRRSRLVAVGDGWLRSPWAGCPRRAPRAPGAQAEVATADEERVVAAVREKAKKAGLGTFEVRWTEHFLGIGDAPPTLHRAEASRSASLLAKDFLDHFREHGFHVELPARRMTVVALKDAASYQALQRGTAATGRRRALRPRHQPAGRSSTSAGSSRTRPVRTPKRVNTFTLVHETAHHALLQHGAAHRRGRHPGRASARGSPPTANSGLRIASRTAIGADEPTAPPVPRDTGAEGPLDSDRDAADATTTLFRRSEDRAARLCRVLAPRALFAAGNPASLPKFRDVPGRTSRGPAERQTRGSRRSRPSARCDDLDTEIQRVCRGECGQRRQMRPSARGWPSTQHGVEPHVLPHLGALLLVVHQELAVAEVLAFLLALGGDEEASPAGCWSARRGRRSACESGRPASRRTPRRSRPRARRRTGRGPGRPGGRSGRRAGGRSGAIRAARCRSRAGRRARRRPRRA